MTKYSLNTSLQILRYHRDEPLIDTDFQINTAYDPVLVNELAHNIIESNSSAVTQVEYYSIMEQLIISYLDLAKYDDAKRYYQRLVTKFPTGSRIHKIKGQIQEYQGNYENAIYIYQKQLEIDPSYMPIAKRLAICLVAKGDRTKAIEILVAYVDTFMQDTEAWQVLAKLYCLQGLYQQACFCYEELLILKPKQHIYMLLYADLLSSLGKNDIALKYYCAVVDLIPNCLQGWLGIQILTKANNGLDCNSEVSESLNNLSREQIKRLYQNGPAPVVRVVDAWLK
jgi:tetratricopeptide (TPR) repeat protein